MFNMTQKQRECWDKKFWGRFSNKIV
jgi:hypothetical protein